MPRITNRPKTLTQLFRETVRARKLNFDAAYLLYQDMMSKAGQPVTGLLTPAPVLADLDVEMRATLTTATTELAAAIATEEAKS